MLIDGKKIAEEILENLKTQVAGRNLKLAAILIGDSPASKKFLELKQRSAEKIGVEYEIHELSTTNMDQLVRQISEIGDDSSNQGVIVELPLPPNLDVQKILDAVPQNKDVDVLSQGSQKAFFTNTSDVFPPAVEAVRIIF